MGKTNYRFNPDTLSFDLIERNIKTLVKRVLGYLSTGVVSGVIFFFIFLQFLILPKQRDSGAKMSNCFRNTIC